MRTIHKIIILINISISLLFIACQKKIDHIYKLAEENKKEIEQTVSYFSKDKKNLKYKSALFLIENMPFHYSTSGKDYKNIDSVYLNAVMQADNKKSSYIRDFTNYNLQEESDLKKIKSEYLIEMVNRACDIWSNSKWKNDYSDDLFLNYVLPYRAGKEPLSNWYKAIDKEFPLLSKSVVLSRRGIQYESEDAESTGCLSINSLGASMNKSIKMLDRSSIITFKINQNKQTSKRLIIRFSSPVPSLKAQLKVNNKAYHSLSFPQTRNIDTYSEKWFNFELVLDSGINKISILNASEKLIVDYIQLGAIEDFNREWAEDFGQFHYSITNKKYNKCITFNNNCTNKNDSIELMKKSIFNTNQILCIDYQGYPIWRISPCNPTTRNTCIENKFGIQETLLPGSHIYQNFFDNKPFQQWIIFPLENGYYRIMNKHSGLYLQAKNDSSEKKYYLTQADYQDNDTQLWKFQKESKRYSRNSIFKLNSALSESLKVFDLTHQFHFFMYNSGLVIKAASLIKGKGGKCIDEANFSLLLCRYLGIPSAIDFTPNWGNRSQGHSWCVIVNPDGSGTPFYMGNIPGDTLHFFHPYKKPKVFRKQFKINKQIVEDFKIEKEIPDLFHFPKFIDVTDEYCSTSDVTIDVSRTTAKNNKIAYICVFDNMELVPVYYGLIENNRATFHSMGRDILYIAGICKNNQIIPCSNPFVIKQNGTIKVIKMHEAIHQNMKLTRKHPFLGEQDYFNLRMDNGLFQGANKKDFSDAITIYKHKGITNGNWYDITIDNYKTNKFKYLRYMGHKGSYCNINELEFYDNENNIIKGKIIGTEGESWAKKENVFDKDILTGFCANSPDGNWVGLELSHPQMIKRIKYIGRNDGNCIEIGDTYELYIWKENKWKRFVSQIAKGNVLQINNAPIGGLFLLRDKTKGTEERPFTYEDGVQKWW